MTERPAEQGPHALQARATSGEELRVDSASIEQTLSQLWRGEKNEGENAVTRAALWNVVAHATTAQHHATASEVLSKAANSVPQRTIVVRADPAAPSEMASWISANCHMLGEGKQVCSEEIAIVAGGRLLERVPPLVNALLIPDMPVALWWVGDLPHENADYVAALLAPVDRLIIDSIAFSHPEDLDLVASVAASNGSAPADLNWVRAEEWRGAAASVFDPAEMRERIRSLRRIRIVAESIDARHFGERLEAVLLASWLISQAGLDPDAVEVEVDLQPAARHRLLRIEIELDGCGARIERDVERGAITTTVDGRVTVPDGITRAASKNLDELIVRELKQPESNRLLLKVLPVARRLAARVAR